MADLYQVSTNITGFDSILVDIVSEIPLFVPMFLLFIFIIIAGSGVLLEKARRGNADYPVWAVIASIGTLMISLVMTLKEGLMRLEWLTIVISVTLIMGLWLFLSKRANEL